ncbi:methylmalonyl-CoA mutase family protein [Streptomyces sp. NPDC048362]|uniref:methylmalonyl-CoA mutase family protein n=1 Tax=Streptomyces sp. NPDC048362 TaxID=3365539 RepID=UPI00371F4422
MRLGLRTSATAATPAFLARGSACECNAHYRQQVERGARHLLVGVDRPTGLGHDSDDPAARGAVGQAGAAIDSVDDMRVLLRGLALDRVTATLLVDLPGAAPLASLWCLVMEERAGGARCRLRIALRPPDPTRMPGPPAERYAERLTALLHAVCTPAGVPVRPAGPHDLAEPWPPRSCSPRTIEAAQAERLAKLRAWRCEDRLDAALTVLRASAAHPADARAPGALRAALAAGATLGEVSGVLRAAWGAPRRTPAFLTVRSQVGHGRRSPVAGNHPSA